MKNYYILLQISPDSSSEEIRKAYKRLAEVHHPDREGGDADKYSHIRTAYETLSDPRKRREHNRSLALGRPSSGSILTDGPIDLSLDFATHRPSLESLRAYIYRRTREGVAKSRQVKHLRVEIVLSRIEAKVGGTLPLEVPIYENCTRCEGDGTLHDIVCPRCDGSGARETRRTVPINIPRDVRDRTLFEYDLAAFELPDTVLHAEIRVR